MTLSRNFVIFEVAFLLLGGVLASVGSACNLPDNAGIGKCMHTRHCKTLFAIIKSSVLPPTTEVKEYLATFACPKPPLVCCPDNAVDSTTESSLVEEPKVPANISVKFLDSIDLTNVPEFPKPLNVEQIANHENINLINKRCGVTRVEKIINGQRADPGQYPWMALIQYKIEGKLEFQCGGSLITDYYVLTAAHCVTNELVAVRLGEHDTSTVEDWKKHAKFAFTVQDIEIESATKYPRYSKDKKQNDIALLRLKSPADIKRPNINTICLPTEEENQFDRMDDDAMKSLTIAGWGTTENKTVSNVLMKANVSFIEKEECKDRLNLEVFDTWLCAGGTTKIDSCFGDSGGPLFAAGYVDEKVKMIQYGIVASGIGCENPRDIFPGIYTNIRYFVKWILDNIA